MPPDLNSSASKPLKVLIAEDEFLLAITLEENLQEHGYEVVGPFSDLASLTEGVRDADFDIALLDVNLGGDRVFPVALSLIERRMTFILLTGYGVGSLPRELQGVPIIAKPYSFPTLENEIQRLTSLKARQPS